ncbi:GntR family transcriptional regulator [candidate division KSB1 bacterium]
MLLNLSDISSEPLQQQIIRQIRAKILTSDLEAGTDLPSIRVFAREHHVSVITVKLAYENLEREGLIHSRRGKGFFVSKIEKENRIMMAEKRLSENLTPLIKAAKSEGLSTKDILKIIEKILNEN